MPRKSRASAADRANRPPPADPYGLALGWLAVRELSGRQVRQRLARRGVDGATADAVVTRLVENGTIDERRMALAAARLETVIRGRGPARTRQKLRALGLSAGDSEQALTATLADVDIEALLDTAIEKKLRRVAGPLDQATTRKVAASLVRQGFEPQAVMTRLRRRAAVRDGD